MKEFLASLATWGPSGLFLAALLDGAGVPVPSGVDVLIVLVTTQLPDRWGWLAAVTVLGSVVGNLLLFALARRGGQVFLEKRTRSKRAQQFRGWFDRYGLMTVFVSALVPLPIMPMKIFVFCSGALGVSPVRFVIAFVSARIPRYVGLSLLGRAMGSDAIGFLRAHVWHLALFAALLFVLLIVLVKRLNARSAAIA